MIDNMLLGYFAGENLVSAENLTFCDRTISFWQGLCVITSTSLGFTILLLRIDQPSQSSHMFDARKTF